MHHRLLYLTEQPPGSHHFWIPQPVPSLGIRRSTAAHSSMGRGPSCLCPFRLLSRPASSVQATSGSYLLMPAGAQSFEPLSWSPLPAQKKSNHSPPSYCLWRCHAIRRSRRSFHISGTPQAPPAAPPRSLDLLAFHGSLCRCCLASSHEGLGRTPSSLAGMAFAGPGAGFGIEGCRSLLLALQNPSRSRSVRECS